MSIGAKEIAFSGYAVTDFDRSIAFYQKTLGLELDFQMSENGGPQWAEFVIGGQTLAIANVPDWNPSKAMLSRSCKHRDMKQANAALYTFLSCHARAQANGTNMHACRAPQLRSMLS